MLRVLATQITKGKVKVRRHWPDFRAQSTATTGSVFNSYHRISFLQVGGGGREGGGGGGGGAIEEEGSYASPTEEDL